MTRVLHGARGIDALVVEEQAIRVVDVRAGCSSVAVRIVRVTVSVVARVREDDGVPGVPRTFSPPFTYQSIVLEHRAAGIVIVVPELTVTAPHKT